jgi:hypothetical protein
MAGRKKIRGKKLNDPAMRASSTRLGSIKWANSWAQIAEISSSEEISSKRELNANSPVVGMAKASANGTSKSQVRGSGTPIRLEVPATMDLNRWSGRRSTLIQRRLRMKSQNNHMKMKHINAPLITNVATPGLSGIAMAQTIKITIHVPRIAVKSITNLSHPHKVNHGNIS